MFESGIALAESCCTIGLRQAALVRQMQKYRVENLVPAFLLRLKNRIVDISVAKMFTSSDYHNHDDERYDVWQYNFFQLF